MESLMPGRYKSKPAPGWASNPPLPPGTDQPVRVAQLPHKGRCIVLKGELLRHAVDLGLTSCGMHRSEATVK